MTSAMAEAWATATGEAEGSSWGSSSILAICRAVTVRGASATGAGWADPGVGGGCGSTLTCLTGALQTGLVAAR
jgi:hypothetical protein